MHNEQRKLASALASVTYQAYLSIHNTYLSSLIIGSLLPYEVSKVRASSLSKVAKLAKVLYLTWPGKSLGQFAPEA